MESAVIPGRLKRTFLAVLTGRGLVALRQLLLVPVLIHAWGAGYYGSWLMLTAIPSFLGMSNLGLGTASYNKIAVELAGGNRHAALRTLASGVLLIALISFITLTAVALCVTAFEVAPITSTGLQHSGAILLMLLTAIFVQMAAVPLTGWWTGSGEPAIGYRQQNVLSIGTFALTAAIPLCGGHGLAVAGATLTWTLVWFLFLIARTHTAFSLPWRVYATGLRDRGLIWNLFKVGSGHQLSQLWQAIYFQGSLLVAGVALGATGAALWGSIRIVSRSGNQSLELVSQSLGPEFQLAYSTGDVAKLKTLHAVGLLASIVLSGVIGLGLVLLGDSAFSIWTGGHFEVAKGVWPPLALSLLAFSLWWISSEVQRSINRPWPINSWAVMAACLSIAYMAATASSQGMIAFAIGSMIFDLLMVLFVLPRTLKIIGQSRAELIGDLGKIVREPKSLLVMSKGKAA